MRGGAANELAVLLDGMRLFEPYHLRDFQGVFSVVDQRIVDSVAVHAGGFPAAYGDALSGLWSSSRASRPSSRMNSA